MRRPDWWPAEIWPGSREADVSTRPENAPDDDRLEAPGSPPEPSRRPPGPSTDGDATSPWPSFLDVLVASLGAASGAVWWHEEEGDRWRPAAERHREGWSGPGRAATGRRGHPFTWSARENLVLQVPAERIRERDREGWVLLVPEPAGRYLVELWFASAPGSAVREAAEAIRTHLAWVAGARRESGPER